MNIPMISAFIIYFCALISLGFYFYRKNSSAVDFIVGNRSVNYWVTAIATQASDMGGWLFLGLPAVIYLHGLFEAWTAIGLVVGMFLTWHFIAPKLRMHTENYNTLTLPSFFARHFNDKSGSIQIVSALLSLIFFTFYIASGLVGLSLLFESAFGIPYHIGIALSLATAALYALVGGFVAVAWCDLFQGIFLLIMIMLVPIVAFAQLPNGLAHIIEAAHNAHKSLSLFSSPKDLLYGLALAAGWGLGYFGQPHILLNFMGIDDPKKIHYAKRVGISWQILVLASSVSIGLIGIGFFNNSLLDSQLVFINMTTALFHPFLAGFILCAILAATLSTVDSLILASGATIAEDIYKPFVKKNISSTQLVFISRTGSIIISIIALIIAWSNDQSVYNLVNYAWSGLGSSFGPLIITSLYKKNVPYSAALAGMVVGGITAALWPYALPLVPGFCFSLITIYVISGITKRA